VVVALGADSPDAIHKLMALSDLVRPHDPHRNKVTPSCVGVSAIGSFKQTSSSSAVMVAPCLTVDSSSVVNHSLHGRPLVGQLFANPCEAGLLLVSCFPIPAKQASCWSVASQSMWSRPLVGQLLANHCGAGLSFVSC